MWRRLCLLSLFMPVTKIGFTKSCSALIWGVFPNITTIMREVSSDATKITISLVLHTLWVARSKTKAMFSRWGTLSWPLQLHLLRYSLSQHINTNYVLLYVYTNRPECCNQARTLAMLDQGNLLSGRWQWNSCLGYNGNRGMKKE